MLHNNNNRSDGNRTEMWAKIGPKTAKCVPGFSVSHVIAKETPVPEGQRYNQLPHHIGWRFVAPLMVCVSES